jgi:hypothetical protein
MTLEAHVLLFFFGKPSNLAFTWLSSNLSFDTDVCTIEFCSTTLRNLVLSWIIPFSEKWKKVKEKSQGATRFLQPVVQELWLIYMDLENTMDATGLQNSTDTTN